MASQGTEFAIKIFAGTIGIVQISVPDNDALSHWIELVLLTKPRRQQIERLHLRVLRLDEIKISRDTNADGIHVVMKCVRSDRRKFSTLLNRAVLANQKMIAATRPTVNFLMKFVNLFDRGIFVAFGKAGVVNYNDFRLRTCLIFREVQVRAFYRRIPQFPAVVSGVDMFGNPAAVSAANFKKFRLSMFKAPF